jgi:hypothetical protein
VGEKRGRSGLSDEPIPLPTYWAGINAELVTQTDSTGAITKVDIRYSRHAVRQYLGYAAMYSASLADTLRRMTGSR